MKRIKLKVKLGVDLAMIAVFLVNIFTGFAFFFGLVYGGGRQYRGTEGFNILSLTELSTRSLYRFLHDWSGILMVILILIHLILNWNTLWCYLKNSFKNIRNEKVQSGCENN